MLRRLCVAPTLLRRALQPRAMSTAPLPHLVSDQVIEHAVGIQVFANRAPGFSAVLKHRWSDFVVAEVGLDGRVCRLAAAPPGAHPAPPVTAPAVAEQAEHGAAPPEVLVASPSPLDDHSAAFAAMEALNQGDVPALRAWVAACAEWESKTKVAGGGGAVAAPPPLLLSPTADKELRSRTHALVRAHLRWAESETGGADAAKAVCVRVAGCKQAPAHKRSRPQEGTDGGAGGGRKRVRVPAPASGVLHSGDAAPSAARPVLSFVLCKENTDTQAALSVLAKLLHVNPRAFGIAGTKDKRGATAQRVTLPRGDARRLMAANARLRGMRVGGVEYVESTLGLGGLSGNAFCVTLRDVQAPHGASDVVLAVQALKASGFLNYFGLQRFGASAAGRTHAIGGALLRGEWQGAVDMIMAPREGDCPEIAAARAAWAERGDAAAALALLPLGAAAERAVMGHFARAAAKACEGKAERNLAGALASIPRTLRMMFIHAYQSYLWNHAASHRAQTYDMEHAVEGDLVADNTPSAGASDAADADEDDAEAQRGGLVAGVRVRQVTAAEAEAKSVPIDDVLLPLPAPSSVYPGNSVREVYARLADGDGVSLSGRQHSVREFSLSGFTGGYRHLMHRPTRLAFRLLRYEDPGRDLTRSDLTAILEAEGRRTVDPLAQPPPEPSVSDDSVQELGQGRYLALQLSFQLPASGYATMLIRELLKTSTTVAFHKGLNAHADE